eukprot:UN26218
MTDVIIDSYDVSSDDITAEVTYVATGSMELSVDDDTSEEDVADAVIATLTELLNVHPRDVTIISVDIETGEVAFEISSEDYDSATSIQSDLDSIRPNDIEDIIQQTIPSAEVDSVDINQEVTVDVSML